MIAPVVPDRTTILDLVAGAVLLVVAASLAAIVLGLGVGHGDPLVFVSFVEPIADGRFPYRDFAIEYPPLGYLAIVLPWLLTGTDQVSAGPYQVLFSLQGALLAVLAGGGVVSLATRGWAFGTPARTAVTYAALALALLPVVIWRFDIVPAFLTTLALVGVAMGRPGLGGAALGLGAVTKVYPAFLVPVVVAYYLANRDRRAAGLVVGGFIVAAALVIAPFALAAGPRVLSFVGYQEARGVEIESTIAGVALLLHMIGGTEADVSFGFGAFQVSSPLIDTLAGPMLIAQLALLIGLVAGASMSFRSDLRTVGAVTPRTLASGLFGVLLFLILTNKVLSPQYLVWLLPFGALATRFQALTLFAACALTTVVYPINFDALLGADPQMVLTLNARNLLLVALFVAVVVPRAWVTPLAARLEGEPMRPIQPTAQRCRNAREFSSPASGTAAR